MKMFLKITWNIFGIHVDLTEGSAWLFVFGLASVELFIVVGILRLLQIAGIL